MPLDLTTLQGVQEFIKTPNLSPKEIMDAVEKANDGILPDFWHKHISWDKPCWVDPELWDSNWKCECGCKTIQSVENIVMASDLTDHSGMQTGDSAFSFVKRDPPQPVQILESETKYYQCKGCGKKIINSKDNLITDRHELIMFILHGKDI